MTSGPKQRKREKKAIRAYLDKLKYGRPCADCGGSFPPHCMDFDHVRGEKAFNLSAAANRRLSWTSVLREVGKCDLVCANCHRIRTQERGQWRQAAPQKRQYAEPQLGLPL